MDDIKKGLREAEETSKEAWRKRDGEDLADKVGNAGDDVRKELGNLGDKVDDVVDETADKVEDVADRTDDARPLDRGY
jgi:hypothetical protein